MARKAEGPAAEIAAGPCTDQLGGEIGAHTRAGITSAQGRTAVYANEPVIGFLIARRHGFDALTASGKSLGRFNDEAAGSNALLLKMGGAPPVGAVLSIFRGRADGC